MKICHVDPGCGVPIPPKGWGAVEKIIWEFKTNQEKLGHEVHIRMAGDIRPGEFDIVHCHIGNLAIFLAERNIPYVYQLHDHHAYHYGKESHVFKQNYEAIDNSLLSLMPAKFLVNYFDHPKCKYFSHGVNTDFYTPNFNLSKKRTFLMLANNGLAGNNAYDRKGFGYGIALASMLGETITIAGPDNNKNFFNENLWTLNYPNLEIVFNPSPKEVKTLYNTHKIFLHPSMLEAGHPNLTMIEAASCGLPLIADWELETDFHGAWRAPRNVFDMLEGYKNIISKYNIYQQEALKTANKLSWFNRTKELIKLYENL